MGAIRDRAKSTLQRLSNLESERAASLFRHRLSGNPRALAYDGLTPYGLSVLATEPAGSSRSINLLLPELNSRNLFAGIRTAIQFGMGLSDRLTLPMRIVSLRGGLGRIQVRSIVRELAAEFAFDPDRVVVVQGTELAGLEVGDSDVWIATHWTTAFPLLVASRLVRVDPANVVYLVQDYEPSFMAWSSEFALARATYHAGFRLVVNSMPVRDYLESTEGLTVDPEMVFRPSLDLARLEAAAHAAANRPGPPRVLFYARPGKPRNLFSIGMAAMALASESLEHNAVTVQFSSAGNTHSVPRSGPLAAMRVYGKLAWADYFTVIGESAVVLSLQHSPHPSHPPLDAIVSGAYAVTNELSGARSGLHPRLRALEPDPVALAGGILDALDDAAQRPEPRAFNPELLNALGDSLDAVIQRVSDELGIG